MRPHRYGVVRTGKSGGNNPLTTRQVVSLLLEKGDRVRDEAASPTDVRLTVSADGAALLGTLVVALLERKWAGCSVTGEAGEYAPFPGEVLVRNRENGRTLSVFHQVNAASVRERLSHPDASAVLFDAPWVDLERGLDALLDQPAFISSSVLQALRDEKASSAGSTNVTPREREVLRLLVRGLSNREIASCLAISPHTVRAHLQAVSQRLEVTSRGKLAAKARELGFE